MQSSLEENVVPKGFKKKIKLNTLLHIQCPLPYTCFLSRSFISNAKMVYNQSCISSPIFDPMQGVNYEKKNQSEEKVKLKRDFYFRCGLIDEIFVKGEKWGTPSQSQHWFSE